MMKFLRMIDLNKEKINFYVFGQETYSTCFGGFITVINLIILALLLLGFGRDFFDRTNPTMIQEIVYPERYPNVTLNNRNFTIAFQFQDVDGNIINADNLVYMEMKYYNYEKTGGVWDSPVVTPLNFSACNRSNFVRPLLYDSFDFKDAICPQMDNLDMGGGWDETYVKYLWGTVTLCQEGKTNSKGQPCGTTEELTKLMQNRLYLSVFYQVYYVNSNNYSLPLNIMYATDFFMIDPLIMKSKSYYFRKGQITTDYGWLLTEDVTEGAMTLDSQTFDIISMSELPESEKTSLADVCIYITKQEEYFSRTYVKIQTLAATVGGTLKIFFVFNGLIGIFLSRKRLLLDLINFGLDPNKNFENLNAGIIELNKNYPSDNTRKIQVSEFPASTSKYPLSVSTSPFRKINLKNSTNQEDMTKNFSPNIKIQKKSRQVPPVQLESNSHHIFKKICSERDKNSRMTIRTATKVVKSLSLWGYIFIFLKKGPQKDKLKQVEKKLLEKLDVTYYFKKDQQFDAMKYILLDKFSRLALEFIHLNEDGGDVAERRDEMLKLLIEKEQDELSDRDKVIIALLNNELKHY